MRTSRRSLVFVTILAVVALLGSSPGAVAQVPPPGEPPTAGSDDGRRSPAPQKPDAAERFKAANPDKARQIIVRFEEDVSEAERDRARRQNEVNTERRYTLFDAEVVVPAGNASPEQTAERLNRDPRVRYAQLNEVYFPQTHGIGAPNDSLYGQLWGMENTGQVIQSVTGTADVDIDANDAWGITEGSSDLVVAVIDTGTDVSHPDLNDNMWVNPGETPGNGVDDDGNGYVDDVHGWDFKHNDNTVFDDVAADAHGTHVSGTVAAEIGNGTGVAGVAPQVKIMPLKFLHDGGTSADAISAIEYATNMGVRISNNSWGCDDCYEQALYDAISASGQAFVAAAGNGGKDNDVSPGYPASYDLANILSVAAVDNTGALAIFSNFGATSVDLAGPGVDVLSTVPSPPAVDGALQNATSAYKTMFWGFGLEDVVGATKRAEMMARAASSHFGLASGAAVLLVDDDGGGSYEAYYSQALTDAGFTNVTTHTVAAGADGPSAATMSAYGAVIWQTGDEFFPLTATDVSNLPTYLDSGGKNLLLAGPDAIYTNETSALVTDYLDVQYLYEGVTSTTLEGMPGSVYEGLVYDVSGSDTDGFPSSYRDAVEPYPGGTSVPALSYPGGEAYEYYPGTSMAAPHAAGAAALVSTLRPGLGPVEIVDVLKATTMPLSSLSGKTVTGGMVNAKNAVDAVRKSTVADFDGDGTTDISVFRPSNGRWYVRGAAASVLWGTNGDVPVPGIYDGDGMSDIAVFRPSNGRWYVRGAAASVLWGTNGDVPVVAPAAIWKAFFDS